MKIGAVEIILYLSEGVTVISVSVNQFGNSFSIFSFRLVPFVLNTVILNVTE